MKKKYQILSLFLSAALAAGTLAGCGKANVQPVSTTEEQAGYTMQTETTAIGSTADTSSAAEEAPGGTTETADEKSGIDVNANDMFSSRDKETGYDADSAVYVSLSDGGSTASGEGITISGGNVTITAKGTYVFSGSLSNGQITVDIDNNEKVQLVFDNVNVANGSTAPLYVKSADKVFVTLAAGSVNSLTNTGAFAAIDENNIDACVFSKEDITFNGGGTLNVSSEQGHGIVSKDSLVLTSGTYNITAGDHGLNGKDDISILDCTLNVTCTEDGLHSENDEDADKGVVYIEGGSITISAGDDGIHAGNYVTINGGNINIAKSCEGIEGQEVNINGGAIYVRASDDGINAAGGADQSGFGPGGFGGQGGDRFNGSASAAVNITGGTLTVNADGDGLDSNGALNISGGTVYVSGPTNAGNGALDFEISGTITGGTLIAVGAAGMAENFGSASTQCSMLVSLRGNGGDTVTVTDASGNVICSYAPEKSFETVVVSAPALQVGGTYTVSTGSDSATVTFTQTIYGGGMGGGPGGMGGGFGGGPGGFGGGRGR